MPHIVRHHHRRQSIMNVQLPSAISVRQISITLLYLLSCLYLPTGVARAQLGSLKTGLCPLASKVQPSSHDAARVCRLDDDCPGDFKCCATSASLFGDASDRVCIMPLPSKTACEHQRDAADNIARTAGPTALNFRPECVPGSGTFAPIQCSSVMDRCWCVDAVGFEVPGTRVAYGRPLNCTSPRVCPNPECRMFCAHGFKLDERNGCPLCQCRNPCDEVRCPRSSQCILEEVNCISDPCPPVSQCMARSLDLQCPFGPALADKPTDGSGSSPTTTFICSNKPNIIGRLCPLNTHDCVVEDGKDYGICCPRNGTKIEEDTTIVIQPVIPAGSNAAGACLLQRGYMIDRALQQFAPKCDAKTGNFAPIQCDYNDEHCYCVDEVSGEEIIGTRRRNGLQPNCAAPAKCVLPTCDPNLKCEHGFEFDASGCPICQCYDPCSESECPSDLCHAVSVDCMRPPCPIVASCKEARSLSNPCHIGRPLVDVQTNDFHVCGQFAQAQPCPEQYSCEIIDAEGHGLCCLSPSSTTISSLSTVPNRIHRPSIVSQDAVSDPLPSSLRTASVAPFAGQCPISSNNRTEKCDVHDPSLRCTFDVDCNQNEKCCERTCDSTGAQHVRVCRTAVTKTQCQMQQEAVDDAQRVASLSTQGGVLGNFRPQCLESNGAYARVQCNTSWCWCVSDAGIELPITRVQRDRVGELNCTGSSTVGGGDSLEPRLECGLQCRMFCPHGFVLNPESGCPECECRSPCDDLKCPAGHECQLHDIECATSPCRAIAKCFPIVQPNPCVGNSAPLRDPVSNVTVRCDVHETAIRGAVPSCPLNYECRHSPSNPKSSTDGRNATGVCCQRQSEDICMQPADVGVCSESLPRWHFNYQSKECEPFLWGGCGGNLNNFKTLDMCQIVCKDSGSGHNNAVTETSASTAVGHCPVPQLVGGNSCRKECAADNDCPGANVKCCSNGCGTRCIEADLKTACQQLRIAATRMQRNLIPNIAQFASSHFVPRCQSNGEFERVQCDAANKWCWCVSPQGMELDGSRQLKSDRIACEVGRAINPVNLCALDQTPQCRLLCPFGFKRNETSGCPTCECIEPCESFQCPAHTYCDIIGVDCTNPPCPAVPTCVPQPIRSVAACAGGDEPLRQVGSDAFAACQDDVECPSTHVCTFAPNISTTTTTTAATVATTNSAANVSMETTGVCCKKTKDICALPMATGPCRAALSRFYFDHAVKQCKQFTYGGCQGNANNFLNADECSMVCLPLVPPLTTTTTTLQPAVTSTSPIPTIARSSLSTTDSSIAIPAARDAVLTAASDRQCPNGGAVLQPFTDGPQDDPSQFCDDHTIMCPLTHTCLPANNASFVCCPKTADVCRQPPEPGMCRGGFPRWFFSQKTQQCEMFLFGGCDGNSNNFASKNQCQQICAAQSGAGALGDAVSCSAKRQSAANDTSLLAYVPQCDHENPALYTSMQCIDTIGLCWCVNQTSGMKISAAQRSGADMNCTDIQESLTTARTGRVLAPMDLVEQTVDICSSTSNDEVSTSAVHKTTLMHECDPTVCKHKVCLGFPHAQCRINPCSSSSDADGQICTVEFFIGSYKVNCSQPLTTCESELQRVVNSDMWQAIRQPLPLRRVKQLSSSTSMTDLKFNAGQCPPFFTLRIDGEQCQQRCHVDSDCSGAENQKCCFNGCGTQCTATMNFQSTAAAVAATPPDTDIIMPLYIPQCSPIDGNYEPTQCAGDICWCVADRESGQPNPNTTARGSSTMLRCNSTAELARITSPSLTCAARGSSLELCTSACLTATCPTHPEALCVADPCRQCQIKFVNAAGEEVDCRSPCEQPANNNKCAENSGIMPRFYYNSAAQQCKVSNLSCASETDNNFASLEDCQHECLPFDPCDQPKAVGICRASIPRWFYNKQTRQCEQFTYGGCRGNMNNFQTEAECEATCPARVVCPRVRITTDQHTNSTVLEATACNRRTTCAAPEAVCAHPLAICDVDPCSAQHQQTCAPIFKDIRGRRVQCDTRPHKCAVEFAERMVMADVYHPQCTAGGESYAPMQCQQDHFNEKCWCVDEAGEPIMQNGQKTYFKRDEKVCEPIAINTTIIRLRFDANRVDVPTILNLLRQETSQILMPNEQQSGALKIDVKLPDSQNSTGENNLIELRLQGPSGIDVAYFIAKRNELRNNHKNAFILNNTNVITSIVVEHERVVSSKTTPVTNDIEDLASRANNTSENLVNIGKPKTTTIENDSPASLNEIDSEQRNANVVGQHNPSTASWKYILPIVLILAVAVLSLLIIGGLLYRRKHCGSYGTRRVAAARAAAANAAAIAEASNAADVPPRNPNFLRQLQQPSTVVISALNAAAGAPLPPPTIGSSTTHRVATMTTTTTAPNSGSNYLSLFTNAEGDVSSPSHIPPNATYDSSPETGRRTYASSLTNSSTTSSDEHNNNNKSRLTRQQTPFAARNV